MQNGKGSKVRSVILASGATTQCVSYTSPQLFVVHTTRVRLASNGRTWLHVRWHRTSKWHLLVPIHKIQNFSRQFLNLSLTIAYLSLLVRMRLRVVRVGRPSSGRRRRHGA
jgi:hypothetical protein